MDKVAIWSGVLISLITAMGALASSRASTKASTANAKTEAEKEAYDRARKMDVETIGRQDAELEEIREQNRLLKEQNEHLNADVKRIDADNRSLHTENRRVLEDNARLRAELRALRLRLTRLERGLHPNDETQITERREDIPPWGDDSSLDAKRDDPPIVEREDHEPYIDTKGDVDGAEPPER